MKRLAYASINAFKIRTSPRPGLGVVLCALGLAACAASAPEESQNLDVTGAYVVTITPDPALSSRHLPDALTFELYLQDSADGTTTEALLQDRNDATVWFERHDDGARVTTARWFVEPRALPESSCINEEQPWMGIDELRLHPYDEDGDGRADGFEGWLQGIQGSYAASEPTEHRLEGPVTATPDRAPPGLRLRGPATDVGVLDDVELISSEFLGQDVEVRLRSDTGEVIVLEPEIDPRRGPFVLPAGAGLSFDTTYRVEVEPPLQDMAGNVAPAPDLEIRTVTDPGLLAEDGFEGAVDALLLGDAAIVTELGLLPATSGEQSLFLPPKSRLIARLPVAPGDTHVRMSARILPIEQDDLVDRYLLVGTDSGPTTVAVNLVDWAFEAWISSEPVDTGFFTMPQASEVTDLEAELPADVQDTVLVQLDNTAICRFPLGQGALLIDDLRVE